MYYSKPTIDPSNDKRIWLPGTYIVKSEDGGATFEEEPTSPTYDVGLKTDHHVLRVDPNNSNHVYVVGDGGLHESFDMGKTYMRFTNIPVAQAYRVAADNRDPYWIYVGLQDNHSWMAPSATRHWLGILNEDWVEIGFSDGTGKAVDKADWHKVYSSSSGRPLSSIPRRAIRWASTRVRLRGSRRTATTGTRRSWPRATRPAPCISAATACSSRKTMARRGRGRRISLDKSIATSSR
jgi:hypothetical protein